MHRTIAQRLNELRKEMKKISAKAFYFSGTDPHNSEYLANHWKTIPYFSGFSGSAATMIVTMNNAALWTDSRYFIQAERELKGTGIDLMKIGVDKTPTHTEWITDQMKNGFIATDLECLSIKAFEAFYHSLDRNNYKIIHGGGCIDAVWTNRPPIPANPIYEHETQFCGKTRKQKIEAIKQYYLDKVGIYGILLSSLDEIAWTFNLRGSDIDYNPVFLSFALIDLRKTVLFVQKACLSSELEKKLTNEGIVIADYNDTNTLFKEHSTVEADPSSTPVKFDAPYAEYIRLCKMGVPTNEIPIPLYDYYEEFVIKHRTSMVKELKAIKNDCEINQIHIAMQKDGVAMVKFLYWIEQNINKGNTHNEYELVNVLNSFRAEQADFVGNSFYPIMSFGENGAIVHRAVSKETAVNVEGNGLLLFDSGGQYPNGTTDVTRTIAIGTPSKEEINDFTLVLKGLIALSSIKFPNGTLGCNLDVLARQALWQQGLNYGHGTGHGIGFFLNVHEGPQSIRQEYNPVSLKPGMVSSNEPGLYKQGKYGIRIENAMVCKKWKSTDFGNFLEFETLTLCPIDKQLINKSILSDSEISWINNYHELCYQKLANELNDDERKYLKEITSKI